MIMGAWKLGAWRPSAKSYVQDGLIAMWDGIENAGWGVHDEGTHIWTNLIGDGPNFGNSSMSFGLDYMTISTTIYGTNLSTATQEALSSGRDCTVQFLVEAGDATWNIPMMLHGGGSVVSFMCVPKRILYANAIVAAGAGTMVVGEDCLFTFVRSGDTGYGYLNDVFLASKTIDATPGITRIYTYASAHKQKRISIYSRALTAAEVAANYAVDAKRFNLQTT